MVEDSQSKLDELLRLERENNQILHSVRRKQHWQTFMAVIYWLVLLGGAVAAYHFLEPYLAQLIKMYNSIQDSVGKISSFR